MTAGDIALPMTRTVHGTLPINTFDLVPENGDYRGLYKMVFEMIQNGELESFNTLENIEDTTGWVHCAKMNTSEKPLIIRP